MISKEKAEEIRRAFDGHAGLYSEDRGEWCDSLELDVSDVEEFMGGAVEFFVRQEDAYRAMAAIDLTARIDTVSGKKDGSNVLNLKLAADTPVESIGQLFVMRGKNIAVKVYDPQMELPIEYHLTPVADGVEAVEPSEEGQL
jgi:hypothetical protein